MKHLSNILKALARVAGRPLLAASMIALAGSAMTVWVFIGRQQADEDKLDHIFDERVTDRYDQIRDAFDRQAERLDQLAGFYRADESVEADEFREFTSHYLRDPAVKALFWVERKTAPGARDQFPVTCVEPLAANATLLGQDIAFSAAWRETLETARDIDDAMSVQGSDLAVADRDGSECFLFLPIYRSGAPHETIADRRANLIGFVGESFQVCTLVGDALKPLPAGGIDTRIYSALSAASDSLVFDHATRHKINSDEIRRAARMRLPDTSINGFLVGQRPWCVVCRPTPGLLNVVDGTESAWVALNGMLLTAAATAWTFGNARRRRTIERLVDERTAELSHEVAERKATEITLRESEDRLKQQRKRLDDILATVPGLVWEAWGAPDAASQRVDFVSNFVETMLGYHADQWLATPSCWLSIVHPDERERAAKEAAAIFAGGKGGSTLCRWIHQDGHCIWAETHTVVMCDDSGTPVAMRGVSLDVTARKVAEAELERAQKQLLIASREAGMAEVATSVLHNVGNVLNSVNISVGVAAEKAGQMKAASLSRLAALLGEHADNLPAFFATHPQGVRFAQFLGQLAQHFAADQKTVLGELESLRTNVEHINEIVAMQQSYATAGGVIEMLPLSDLVEDALRMNSAAFDRHGTRLVRDFDPSLPPVAVDRNKVLLILVNLIRNAKYACDDTGRNDKCITVRTHLNGHGLAKISVSDNGIGIAPENLLRIFEHGFTTRKSVNNMLGPILMGTQLLSGLSKDPSAEMIIKTIEENAERAGEVVKQVLTFARGMDGERAPLDLGHLIRDMKKVMSGTFPKSITLEVESEKGLAPVDGDATQLHQVLLNLCVNARDAMPDGGTLALQAENFEIDENYASMTPEAHAGRYIVIRARDTGCGIPREVIDKIFDPFFTTKPIGKGTGLGLSTVAGIVRGHGGFINVSSRLGKGTVFEIFLPASLADPAHEESHAPKTVPRGNGELVLIVDDECGIREITAAILHENGYETLAAADGSEALSLYAAHAGEIKAVLTDVIMPFVDGVALCRALRKINPLLKLIASTGDEEGTRRMELDALHVQGFLAKPFGAEKLLSTLREVLESGSTTALLA